MGGSAGVELAPSVDSLARAYATLELKPSASPAEVRRQFKRLAKRWHPDRFAADPKGQAEAARQMRQINEAYQQIRDGAARTAPEPRTASPHPEVASAPHDRVASRLSRSTIDSIVRAIRNESPVNVLLDFFAWSWPLFLALLINPPRYQWLQDELAGRPHSPVLVAQLLLVAVAVYLRRRQTSKRRDA